MEEHKPEYDNMIVIGKSVEKLNLENEYEEDESNKSDMLVNSYGCHIFISQIREEGTLIVPKGGKGLVVGSQFLFRSIKNVSRASAGGDAVSSFILMK
jgi:hypothetical protein